jgi:hypothetical protein
MVERVNLVRIASVVTVLGLAVALSGCSSAVEERSPQQTIDAWAAIACDGATDVRTNPGEGDAVMSGACTLPNESLAMSQRRQYIEVYESESAVRTKIAGVDCGNGMLRLTGTDWYAQTLIREIATGLQDEMGGKLAC